MAARHRTWTPEVVRQKIRTSMLVRRLQKQALGLIKLDAGQQRAIEILLRKTLPDQSAVIHTGSIANDVRQLTNSELDRRIAALEGEARSSSGSEQPSEVH